MTARDANNATWYILRYASDFTARTASASDPVPPQFVPSDPPALVYDASRHVLELTPAPPQQEASPPPGLVVGLEGEIYQVGPTGRNVICCRCDGSEAPLLCEPGIVVAPVGLALDRRGFLYIADPAAHRVVVLRPEDASSVAILTEGLDEPVDVAIAPSGHVLIADRAAGRVVRYRSNFTRIGEYVARGTEGLPATPRPIAVMCDADGTVLVADGNYPWLLRFSSVGTPLGDVSLAALAGELAAQGNTLSDLRSLLPTVEPSVIAGACSGPYTKDHSGAALARMHRDVRLLALNLSHSFMPNGEFLSAALDSGIPGTIWHKLILDAVLPNNGWITIETASSDTLSALADPNLTWASAQMDGKPIPFSTDLPDQLVQSPPGRYLRVRITLGGDGQETPSLNWLKILYPRGSYLNLLPRIYQQDPQSALFLQHYLALFEHVLTGIENTFDAFAAQLNPAAASADVLDWLAGLLDLSFDPSWTLGRRRVLAAEASALYRQRGTIPGLMRLIEIYTGREPSILESHRLRPLQPAFLGVGQSILGCGVCLAPPSDTEPPEVALQAAYAHRFIIFVYFCELCEAKTMLPVIERIISMNAPAHTVHELRAVYPDARVGEQSIVGIDFIVGPGAAPPLPLGVRSQSLPIRASALGINTVLNDTRPGYARPVTQLL